MSNIANIFVLFIAVIHIYIFVLQSFMWTSPRGRRAFGMNEQQAAMTSVLAKNQGFYNLFLAAGLIWSLVTTNADLAFQLRIFFLVCVFVAGIVGGITAHKKIIYIQSIPAALALSLVFSS